MKFTIDIGLDRKNVYDTEEVETRQQEKRQKVEKYRELIRSASETKANSEVTSSSPTAEELAPSPVEPDFPEAEIVQIVVYVHHQKLANVFGEGVRIPAELLTSDSFILNCREEECESLVEKWRRYHPNVSEE